MNPDNPYQAPEGSRGQAEEEPANVGVGKLYSKGGVLWAGFFGTFLAGGFVMYLNYKRMKMPLQAQKMIIGSVIGTVVYFCIVMLLPDKVPNIVYTVATLLPLNFVYDRYQGELFAQHLRRKGEKGSNWVCVGIGLVSLVLVVTVVFGVGMALYSMGLIKDD